MNVTRQFSTGAQEGRLLTDLERFGIAVFSMEKHRGLLQDLSDQQLNDALYRLNAKGWLIKIERGKHLVVPRAARGVWHEHPFVIAAGIAPTEHYISYWSALSFHKLTEQIPRIVHIALREKKRPAISFQQWEYQFVCLSANKFFGYQEEDFPALNGAAHIQVPVAEPEKAILDSLDQEGLAGGFPEIVKALRRGLADKIISVDRLLAYSKRYPNAAVVARLGYLLDQFAIERADELLSRVRNRGPLIQLSPAALHKELTLSHRWHLLVNVPDTVFAGEDEF